MVELDISGNSIQLDCSVDSGICVEGVTKDLKKKLEEFKRILLILERDKGTMRLLRERLSRLAERKIIKKKKDEQFLCNICFASIDIDDPKTCVACFSCAKNVCRGEKCSEWVPKEGEWKCQLCDAQRDSYGKASTWVQEQNAVKRACSVELSYGMRARSEIYIPLCDPNESAFLCNFESVSEASSPVHPNQKQQIRDYIEEVLADIIGGSLKTTKVEQIATNGNYQQIRNGHDLQGISNVRLRRLIENIITETIRQPPFASAGLITTTIDESNDGNHEALQLNGNHCNGNGGQYFESKKYQDLLATAVLNKIVSTHGNERHSESSPDLTTSSILDNNHNDLNLNKTDESISSVSSVEPRSESSFTDLIRSINKDDEKYTGNFYDDAANDNIEVDRESVLSDFVSSHMVPLPQISTEPASDEEEEDEDFISVTSSRDATWEDNWLFKKKKSNKTTTSTVGMLVPAPKEDIRALIGDKPTDEVSDLSEAGSDTDDSSLEMISASLEPLNDRLVNKHLIGGKNTKIVLDELSDRTSMISTTSLPDNVPAYTETKNEFVVSNDGLNESQSSKISVNNCNKALSNEAVNANVTRTDKLSLKESELAEDDQIVPPPNDFTDDEKMRNLLAKFNEEQNNKTDMADDNSSSLSPRSSISCALSGSIAEREYKKWYNAVDMPNNPYSVEALRRRLSGSVDRVLDLPNISPCIEDKPLLLGQSAGSEADIREQDRDYARYSRDYYINDAKHASGITKKSQNIPPEIASPTPTASSVELEESSRCVEKTPVKEMCHKLEKQNNVESDIYQASPAVVIEDAPETSVDTNSSTKPVVEEVNSLTNESANKLSSDTSSVLTNASLTPSEDSDTIRIYDLKKQETRFVKESTHTTTINVPKSDEKKIRPSELDISPTMAAPTATISSKCSTPTSFKFLQPKRKLINPSQVLSIDQDTTPITPSTPTPSEKPSVIEAEVAHAMPSVKALAKAFLMTSHTPTSDNKWRKARAKSPLQLFKITQTAQTSVNKVIQKTAEPVQMVADTASQGSEDATIASDLSSLETDPPSKIDGGDNVDSNVNQERVVLSGCLRNNIAFFENLKNK